jgi:hypothetical protein
MNWDAEPLPSVMDFIIGLSLLLRWPVVGAVALFILLKAFT